MKHCTLSVKVAYIVIRTSRRVRLYAPLYPCDLLGFELLILRVVVSYNQELVTLIVIERLRVTGSHMAPCQILHALFTQEYNVF